MPFPFETEYHYHFKTDAPLTIQKQRTVSRCPGITSAPAADRTFAWFYESATTKKTPPFTAKAVNRDSIKSKSLGDERRGIYPPHHARSSHESTQIPAAAVRGAVGTVPAAAAAQGRNGRVLAFASAGMPARGGCPAAARAGLERRGHQNRTPHAAPDGAHRRQGPRRCGIRA